MTRYEKDIIKDLCPFWKEYGSCKQCNEELDVDDEPCYWECMANAIIRNGYRKQEWISVKYRLPGDGEERVMVALNTEEYIGGNKIDTDRYLDGRWVRWGDSVTHWMPLPDAPKGGDNDAR